MLIVEDLYKTYKSGDVPFPALKGVSFKIDAGEFVAFVGPSGSGKTTLLNCLGCIDSCDSGSIRFNGEDLAALQGEQLTKIRRERFGFVFQTFNLIPVLNVYENIEIPLRLLKLRADDIDHKVMDIIKKVGLDGLERRLPSELSGGQQQRVSIARSLIKEPDVVFADEPTANLDSVTGATIVDLMKEMNQVFKTTFVFSTHDPQIMEHALRLITIRDGHIEV